MHLQNKEVFVEYVEYDDIVPMIELTQPIVCEYISISVKNKERQIFD